MMTTPIILFLKIVMITFFFCYLNSNDYTPLFVTKNINDYTRYFVTKIVMTIFPYLVPKRVMTNDHVIDTGTKRD